MAKTIDEGAYRPGVCNINEAERKRRKMTGWLSLILAGFLLLFLIQSQAPMWWRAFLFIPFFIGVLGILQHHGRFCVYHGLRGTEYTGKRTVNAPGRASDRARSILILLRSTLIGAGLTILAFAI